MSLAAIRVVQPSRAGAPVLRVLGYTRVSRLASMSSYHIDWVDFAAGHETEMHAHEGVEHHFVVSGTVSATFDGHVDLFEAGDYFFWDGRRPHTSFAAAPGAATMLMVRTTAGGVNPDGYRVCRISEPDSNGSICDGFRHLTIRTAGKAPIWTRSQSFLLLAASAGNVLINQEQVDVDADHPVLLCDNATGGSVRIVSDQPLAFMDIAP